MRKLFCLLLALAACCLLATVASAETTVPTTCEACGGIEVEWEPVPSTWYLLDEGHYHYYLTEKTTQYRYTPNPVGTVSSTNSGNAVTICLDLNGFGYETDGRAMGVYQGCTLNIMDSSAEKTGYVKAASGNNATVGGTFFVYGTLNTYDVLLQYENDGTGTNQAYAGGVIRVGSSTYTNAVFNMYGGRVEGGAMVSHDNTKGATLCAEYGTVNLYGGDVISGSVPEGKVAPCIYIGNSVQLNLSGNTNVDNIYVNGTKAKVNINGTYSGTARLTCSSTPTEGKVIGTGSNTPKLTGDLFCTNGNGWIVALDGTNLKLKAYTPSGEWHYCEHCKEVRRWTDYNSSNFMTPNTTVGTYHYYLSQDQTGGAKYPQLKNGSVVCLDMYGNSLTCAGRALLVNGGCTLSVMDTQGGGFIAGGPGINNPRGGTATVSGTATLNMYSGTLKYIPGSGDAKNGMLAIGGVLNMYGGKIEGADMSNQSASVGGAVYLYNSNGVDGVLNAYGGEITSGKVGSGKGACVYDFCGNGSVNLSGDAKVENIYFPSNNKKLTVSGTYSGTAGVTYGSVSGLELGTQVGTSVDAEITGSLHCTNNDWLIVPEEDQLVLAINAPVVIVSDGEETGYETLQKAIDSYESGYIKLFKSISETVTVDKTLYLDLNGKSASAAVTDGVTLYVKDAQTDDYTVADGIYGTLTASGNVCAQEGYMAVTEGDKLSFHRLTVQITDMTLRPSAAGIYYKCSFLGDEKVAALIESFGVALSVYEIPNAANMDSVCGYTTYTGFEAGIDGNATTSSLLKGVLKETNSQQINTENLNMQIYGRPYIKTASGYVFGQVRCRSLSDQLERIDSGFDALSGSQRNAILTMYETFQTTLETIALPNIAEEKEMNEETLSILMVGNSFCYYYVEELYGLLMANPDPDRGYTNVEIYNLYYSGCKLNQHYDWWIAGEAKYELYKTDANGRKKQTSSATGAVWSLEETLQQGRWDYISLQGASGELNYVSGSVANNCASVTQYAEPLLDHFHQLHPYAQLLWHRTWAFEVGRISGGTTYTEESLAQYDTGMQAVCDYMCNEFDQDKPYDLMMVNSGAAWTVAREENAKLETSLIPEGGLCARLNVRNESTFPYYTGNASAGDGYHDGDIGGGQFLNACVWYETLTGQSVLDNPYAPNTTNGKYTLSDAFVALLRNAAHTVVSEE